MKQRVFLLFLSVLFVCSASAQLLWKVEGKNLAKPSYIMGTQHLAKQSFVDSVPGLRDAFAVCEQVYGELSLDALSDPVAVQRMQLAMMLPGEQTIDQVLSADEMARLNAFMTQWMGADFSNPMLQPMKRMTPAALNAQFQLLMGIKIEKGFNMEQQFDAYFLKTAAEQGKRVGGLETLEFQTQVLYGSTTLERQKEQLMCLVDNQTYMYDITKRLITAFYSQNLAAVEQVMNEKMHNSCDATPEEEEVLIYGRNADWAKRLPPIMKQGSTFVAVGVAHLPGERGLLALLKKAGYTVSPVK